MHSWFLVSLLFYSLQWLALGVLNEEVSQVIDASSSIVHYNAEIKTSDVKDEYVFLLPAKWGESLSYFSASSKGKSLLVLPAVSKGNFTEIVIKVQDSNPTIKVKGVFTSLLVPYPAEITQSEQQLVLLEANHYFLSPYETVSQKSVFKLASSSIESFTKISPHSVRGSSIHFGPFQSVPPVKVSPLKIHYVNNVPFAKFSTLIREVEVSHWGSISIEEIYELQHAGAKLKGGFSRFDYQMRRTSQSPSFRSLTAHLPAQATNIYYRDQIGNISTSDLRSVSRDQLELEVQTRFPIFGGWQTQFYIGYSIPTELALFRDSGDRYTLKFDFFTIFQGVWVDDMEIKVILPEGCQNIETNVPYSVLQSETVRFTFLDSQLNGGRKVLVMKAKNIVEEHDQKVTISYDFVQSRMIVEPLMLCAVFLSIFVGLSVLSRVSGLSTTKSSK